MSTTDQPIACDLSVFTEDERNAQARIGSRMQAELIEVRELDDGFAFRYPDGRTLIEDLARFITLERRCCPFFTFDLSLQSNDHLWLSLRGTPAVKDYVRRETLPVFQAEGQAADAGPSTNDSS